MYAEDDLFSRAKGDVRVCVVERGMGVVSKVDAMCEVVVVLEVFDMNEVYRGGHDVCSKEVRE